MDRWKDKTKVNRPSWFTNFSASWQARHRSSGTPRGNCRGNKRAKLPYSKRAKPKLKAFSKQITFRNKRFTYLHKAFRHNKLNWTRVQMFNQEHQRIAFTHNLLKTKRLRLTDLVILAISKVLPLFSIEKVPRQRIHQWISRHLYLDPLLKVNKEVIKPTVVPCHNKSKTIRPENIIAQSRRVVVRSRTINL